MSGNEKERCRKVADAVSSLLEEGLTPKSDAVGFVESVLGDVSGAALRAVLEDEEHPERDVLLELLLFPGVEFQCRLEPWLGGAEFNRCGREEVTALLGERALFARLRGPVGAPEDWDGIRLTMPGDMVERFVGRLHLERRLPEDVVAALEKCVPEEDRMLARVRLRNGRFSCSPRRWNFLRELVEARGGAEAFLNLLDCTLRLLGETPSGTPLPEAVGDKRRRLTEMLRRSRQVAVRLQKESPEAVMLSGERVLAVDEDAVMAEMAALDAIALAVWGILPDDGNDAVQDEALGSFDVSDAAKLMRYLS